MTYDELLVQIDRIMNHEDWVLKKKYFKALRAVVELHKPTEAWGDTHCGFCFDLAWEPSGLEMMDKHFAYPCPTIQQIIENLK